jgi:hypothetical protein
MEFAMVPLAGRRRRSPRKSSKRAVKTVLDLKATLMKRD